MSGRRTSSAMSAEERRVLIAAHDWWKQHRPVRWTLAEHMQNPTVNTTTPPEARLAAYVAAMVTPKRQRT